MSFYVIVWLRQHPYLCHVFIPDYVYRWNVCHYVICPLLKVFYVIFYIIQLITKEYLRLLHKRRFEWNYCINRAKSQIRVIFFNIWAKLQEMCFLTWFWNTFKWWLRRRLTQWSRASWWYSGPWAGLSGAGKALYPGKVLLSWIFVVDNLYVHSNLSCTENMILLFFAQFLNDSFPHIWLENTPFETILAFILIQQEQSRFEAKIKPKFATCFWLLTTLRRSCEPDTAGLQSRRSPCQEDWGVGCPQICLRCVFEPCFIFWKKTTILT